MQPTLRVREARDDGGGHADTVRTASLRLTPSVVCDRRSAVTVAPPVDSTGTPVSVTEPPTPPTRALGYPNATSAAVLRLTVIVNVAGTAAMPCGSTA